MTKNEAIELFDSQSDLARALRVSRQLISAWSDELSERHCNEVLGAALRRGLLDFTGCNIQSERRLNQAIGEAVRMSAAVVPGWRLAIDAEWRNTNGKTKV